MQSAVPHVLEVLDRQHRPGRPEEAVAEARAAGFEHVNLDLIYGAPNETDADWQALPRRGDRGRARPHQRLRPGGRGRAPRWPARWRRGVVEAPDDDVLADRYVQADETLQRGRLRLVRGVELGP